MESKTAKAKRRWFRFSLRAILVLMLVLGSGIGWIGAKRLESKRQLDAVNAVVECGAIEDSPPVIFPVSYDIVLYETGPWYERRKPQTILPRWLLKLTGEEWLHQVVEIDLAGHNRVEGKDLRPLRSLNDVIKLNLQGTSVADDAFQHISHLKRLQELSLAETKISDAGLTSLKQLDDIRRLDLWATDVSDTRLCLKIA